MQNVCCECATAGISQSCEVGQRCACCGHVAALVIAGRTWAESKAAFIERAFIALEAAREAAKAPVAVVVEAAAPVAVVAVKPARRSGRCPHYTTIKAFFAAAREHGLDTVSESGKDRCRGALGCYLGKRIASRAELTANDWENGISGVKTNLLFW